MTKRTEKPCGDCGRVFPINAAYFHPYRDGRYFRSQCRACYNAALQRYRTANAAARANYMRGYEVRKKKAKFERIIENVNRG